MAQRTELSAQARPALFLSPEIQLGLAVLQASKAELRAMVARELEANPALDQEEDEEGESDSPAPLQPEELPKPENLAEGVPGGEDERDDPASWWQEQRDRLVRGDVPVDSWPSRPADFREILIRQLRLSEDLPNILFVGEYLIGCLDERGYLAVSIEEAAQDLAMPAAWIERGLAAVQRLDPPGVGARDLRECLLLQLRSLPDFAGPALEIVDRCFPELLQGRWSEICRILRISSEECAGAARRIRKLSSHPAAAFPGERAPAIDPDLIVERVGEGFEVYPNDRGLPRLYLCGGWRSWAGGARDPGAEPYRDRLRAARWFLQACHRRRATMLRVMQCILEEQREFFERGVAALKPLTLREVAHRLGFHESTVARVARDKYVQTPRGIFPLRYFFGGGFQAGPEGATSARAVGERIRLLCSGEDRSSPRSDDEIARVLRAEGIRVARRTVAKYRARLGIARSALRRGCPAPSGPGRPGKRAQGGR